MGVVPLGLGCVGLTVCVRGAVGPVVVVVVAAMSCYLLLLAADRLSHMLILLLACMGGRHDR